MSPQAPVIVVDGDPNQRDSVARVVQAVGAEAREFATAEEFLRLECDHLRCVVAELRLEGVGGLDLLQTLRGRGCISPFILTAFDARAPLVVRAMRAGALTVLEKPYQEEELSEAISEGLSLAGELESRRERMADVRQRFASLSESETVVLEHIARGEQNKATAAVLGVSLRTIENRRRSVFTKLGVGNIAELVALKVRAESQALTTACPHCESDVLQTRALSSKSATE